MSKSMFSANIYRFYILCIRDRLVERDLSIGTHVIKCKPKGFFVIFWQLWPKYDFRLKARNYTQYEYQSKDLNETITNTQFLFSKVYKIIYFC